MVSSSPRARQRSIECRSWVFGKTAHLEGVARISEVLGLLELGENEAIASVDPKLESPTLLRILKQSSSLSSRSGDRFRVFVERFDTARKKAKELRSTMPEARIHAPALWTILLQGSQRPGDAQERSTEAL